MHTIHMYHRYPVSARQTGHGKSPNVAAVPISVRYKTLTICMFHLNGVIRYNFSQVNITKYEYLRRQQLQNSRRNNQIWASICLFLIIWKDSISCKLEESEKDV